MHAFKPIILSILTCQAAIAGEWLPLWPGEAPGGNRPAVVTETEREGGRLTDIAVPQYQVFLPEPAKRSGAAVVILPGGGYTILAMGHEGHDYANWLSARGIVAVLVKYRDSGNDEAGYQFSVPVTCHVFEEGGHGFGLKGKGDSAHWPVLFEKWLIGRKLSNPGGRE